MLRKTFKYRCFTNIGTAKKAFKEFDRNALVWNEALAVRNLYFELSKTYDQIRPIYDYKQQYWMIGQKYNPRFKGIDAQGLQDVQVKLHGSFRSFFELRKNGDKNARPPRYKNRYKCIVRRQSGWKLEEKNLYISGVGRFKIKLHRPIEGTIKTVTINRKGPKWFVSFSVEMPEPELKNGKRKISLIFDDYFFLIDSEGGFVEFPEFYFSEIAELRRLNRSLSRKEKASNSRKKAKRALARWHEKIANRRDNFIKNKAFYYAENYDIIEISVLPYKNMIQYAGSSEKAMKLCDASRSKFTQALKFKCLEKGTILIERKDEQWQQQKEKSLETAKMQELQRLLRQAKRAVKRKCRARFKFLEMACERLTTLQI